MHDLPGCSEEPVLQSGLQERLTGSKKSQSFLIMAWIHRTLTAFSRREMLLQLVLLAMLLMISRILIMIDRSSNSFGSSFE